MIQEIHAQPGGEETKKSSSLSQHAEGIWKALEKQLLYKNGVYQNGIALNTVESVCMGTKKDSHSKRDLDMWLRKQDRQE